MTEEHSSAVRPPWTDAQYIALRSKRRTLDMSIFRATPFSGRFHLASPAAESPEVGGSSASSAGAPDPRKAAVDCEEALGEDVPVELWTRRLRGRGKVEL